MPANQGACRGGCGPERTRLFKCARSQSRTAAGMTRLKYGYPLSRLPRGGVHSTAPLSKCLKDRMQVVDGVPVPPWTNRQRVSRNR